MTRGYVITEEQVDADLLQKLFPKMILDGVIIKAGKGKYEARSMASTLLVTRRLPLALIVSAINEDRDEVEKYAQILLGQVAGSIPFRVLVKETPEISSSLIAELTSFLSAVVAEPS